MISTVQRITAAFILAATALLISAVGAWSASGVEVITHFDPSSFEFPEAMAVGRQGHIFVSMGFTGEIKEVTPEGDSTTFANLPAPGAGFMTGLVFDRQGNLYAGMASFDPATHGIWKIDKDGNATLWVPLNTGGAPDGLPNDLAFDQRGNLYVSDTVGGKIWKITREGDVSVWVADESLEGDPSGFPLCPPACFPKGANGIVFDKNHHNLYVANTAFGTIIRIPVERSGEAGTPQIFAADPLLVGADGITMDNHGRIYVAILSPEHISVVSPNGAVSLFADGAPIQNPSDVALSRNGKTLYITNFALERFFFGGEPPDPALLSMQVSKKP